MGNRYIADTDRLSLQLSKFDSHHLHRNHRTITPLKSFLTHDFGMSDHRTEREDSPIDPKAAADIALYEAFLNTRFDEPAQPPPTWVRKTPPDEFVVDPNSETRFPLFLRPHDPTKRHEHDSVIDQDESGCYDPAQDKAMKRRKRSATKKNRRSRKIAKRQEQISNAEVIGNQSGNHEENEEDGSSLGVHRQKNVNQQGANHAEEAIEPGHRMINSSLSHPIHFNHNGIEACDWCRDPFYGLIGLPMKRLHVVDHKDGQGYVEVGPGFASEGFSPSYMCMICTTERMGIVSCTHTIRSMKPGDIPQEVVDVKHWLDPIWAATAPFIWCSICPNNIAEHECCSDENGRGPCGLKLCRGCATLLESFSADGFNALPLLIEDLRVDVPGSFALRADAYLLHPEEEMVQLVERALGEES